MTPTPANDDATNGCWVDVMIGAAVRQRRLELRMGQGELAAKAGTPLSHIEHYESGAWRAPADTLVRLADALQAPLNELLKAI